MRAALGLLSLVVVMAIVLSLAKKQTQVHVSPPGTAASSAGAPARSTPEAVGQQVQGAIDAAAQRASDAQP